MRSTQTTVAEFPARAADAMPAPAHAQLVTIVSIADDGAPLVLVDARGPVVTARLAVRTNIERMQRAIANRQPAVVVFEGGDRSKPLIVGFLEQLDGVPESSPAASAETSGAVQELSVPDPAAAPDEPPVLPFIEADIDGRRVRLTAQDEIVLQCGSASVTLRRNGRVVIRGAYVETHSEGTNRIKGGQVHIN
jgi:Domain of unknown function (DUF6484)